MSSHTIAESARQLGAAADAAWAVLLAARALTVDLEAAGRRRMFACVGGDALLALPAETSNAAMAWHPDRGWECLLPDTDDRAEFLRLYLPICSATLRRPMTIGHLGQSRDGFIATPSGDSQFVTGEDNLVHVHRMRALCDAVVVGAGTVAADDPQLTTRHVAGPNPLRVVVDPGRRLTPAFKVFNDRQAQTLYICGRTHLAQGERQMGAADVVAIDEDEPRHEVTQVLHILRSRGCGRVLVEGGGVTVSAFL